MLMYTRVFFARHGAMLFVVPARVVGSQRLHQQLLQQVEHKHSRPQRGRWRPQRTRAVSWQRGRDADQRGRPHPRPLAAAEERHRVGELAAHVRQGSTAVAAVAERRAVPRNEQPYACISGARRSELAGSTAVGAVRTEGVRHCVTHWVHGPAPAATYTYHGSRPVASPSSENASRTCAL